jgi:hypothetical protein
MIVVAGHLQVEPDARAPDLQGCRDVVRLARAADPAFARSVAYADPPTVRPHPPWATGWMLWLKRKVLSGSYSPLTAASRR